jgi:hypothetical protein
LLPFQNKQINPETVLIEDGFGNAIELPKKGCLTVGEQQAIESYYQNLEGGVTQMQANLMEITILLKSRFNESDLTPEQVAEQAVTVPMVERLYEFVKGEKTRWIPEECVLDLTGEMANEVAIATAQRINGVVATRPDLLAGKRYLVFRSKGFWLDNLEIVKDFVEESTSLGKLIPLNHKH